MIFTSSRVYFTQIIITLNCLMRFTNITYQLAFHLSYSHYHRNCSRKVYNTFEALSYHKMFTIWQINFFSLHFNFTISSLSSCLECHIRGWLSIHSSQKMALRAFYFINIHRTFTKICFLYLIHNEFFNIGNFACFQSLKIGNGNRDHATSSKRGRTERFTT